MTPFELDIQKVAAGKWHDPHPDLPYKISLHISILGKMIEGVKFPPCLSFKLMKKYYGLKGRSRKECLTQLIKIEEKIK